MSHREAADRYADRMRTAGLDVIVTEPAPGQIRVSGRVQAHQQYGNDLVCSGDEGDHDGRAMTIVFTDPDGAEVDRSGPHCRRHATVRADAWKASPDPRGWVATVMEDEESEYLNGGQGR